VLNKDSPGGKLIMYDFLFSKQSGFLPQNAGCAAHYHSRPEFYKATSLDAFRLQAKSIAKDMMAHLMDDYELEELCDRINLQVAKEEEQKRSHQLLCRGHKK